MKNRFFHKKWPLHLLTLTMAFLSPLFSSGTRSATLFFGSNFVSQNIPLALELALSYQHLDAVCTEACAGKDVTTEEDAKRVFSALGQNDARALCFLWLCLPFEQRDAALIRRAAELGFSFAQAWLARVSRGDEKRRFAQLAAAQGERYGLYLLGCCFRDGHGGELDLDKAKENFLLASELGDALAMDMLGASVPVSDPQRWRWWGQAAACGTSWNFLSTFAKQGSGSAAVMFAIGRALQGHVSEEARTIFNDSYKFDFLFGPAKQAIAFYEAQIKATKDAMRAWTLVGLRFKVVKDVRKLIAKLIWDSREEALYKT
jgi:TPR repeat protein